MAIRGVGESAAERLQRRLAGGEVGLAALHPHAQQGQRREQAARAGVGGKLAEEGLGVDGAVHQAAQRLVVEEQQPVGLQEGGGVRAAHAAQMRGVAGQRPREAGGGLVGLLGSDGVHHRHQLVGELREGTGEGQIPLAPGQRGGEHLVGVGGDAEPGHGEPAR